MIWSRRCAAFSNSSFVAASAISASISRITRARQASSLCAKITLRSTVHPAPAITAKQFIQLSSDAVRNAGRGACAPAANTSTATDALTIGEIHYHPHDPTAEELALDATFTAADFEFLELHTAGEAPVS